MKFITQGLILAINPKATHETKIPSTQAFLTEVETI